MDNIMSAVAGHVGSKEVINIAKARTMKRKDVFVPIEMLRDADNQAMRSLLGGGLN